MSTALGFGAGGTQRAAIAVTIIGGQSLCLLLTLLVTPVAYSLVADMQAKRILAPFGTRLARLRLNMARVFTLHLR
jgi:hydrophobic/amphiphilic exporter-1 (mainly G- bacteria), HAE1 family